MCRTRDGSSGNRAAAELDAAAATTAAAMWRHQQQRPLLLATTAMLAMLLLLLLAPQPAAGSAVTVGRATFGERAHCFLAFQPGAIGLPPAKARGGSAQRPPLLHPPFQTLITPRPNFTTQKHNRRQRHANRRGRGRRDARRAARRPLDRRAERRRGGGARRRGRVWDAQRRWRQRAVRAAVRVAAGAAV